MTTKRPSALVIDRDGDSRRQIKSLLCDTGFAVADCAHSRDGLIALAQRRFDLAVVAGELRDGSDGLAAARRLQSRQNGLKVVVLTPAGAVSPARSNDDLRLIAQPLDERRLGAVILELMASDADVAAAEAGVIEAQLACLLDRMAAAERSGSPYLERDIALQIRDATAARRTLRHAGRAAVEIA